MFHLYADTLFKDIPKIYVHITLLTIPFLLYQKFVQYMLLGKEQIGTRNIIVLVPAVANFVLIICFVVIMRLDLWGVILCSLVVNLLAAMLCFYFISKKSKMKIDIDFKLFIESVKFGVIPFLALAYYKFEFQG